MHLLPYSWCRVSTRTAVAATPPIRRNRRATPGLSGLESRQMLTGGLLGPGTVQVLSVSPDAGKGVNVSYRVDADNLGSPVTLGIYRSSDPQLNADDVLVGTLDLSGSDVARGVHQKEVVLDGGLTPNPQHPYVIAAAQGDASSHAADPVTPSFAEFRSYSIAVVSHGGIQNPNWASIPKWEGVMAHGLREQGYDAVIPFNWVKVSGKAGYARPQGIRMSRQILQAAAGFPADAPVDLHVIGHSEGAVVASQALARLEPQMTPNLRNGFIQVTLLDPHAANTGVPGQQYSTGHGPVAWIAKGLIDHYQSLAKDPAIVFSPRVNLIEVFYQQSPASKGDATNRHIYNLWGQVPLRQPAVYFDLTQAGATHAGQYGVPTWYQRNVLPLLGDGEAAVHASKLTVALNPGDAAPGQPTVATTHTPTFEGQAAPGSTVHLLYASASNPTQLSVLGRTVADSTGTWMLTTHSLALGRYRLLARSMPPKNMPGPRLPMVPTAPLGGFTIDTRG
ncbi:MAG: hypothetical protein U0794_01795 [Isosphaeraceae bacterium]